jgi:hypothetical protein
MTAAYGATQFEALWVSEQQRDKSGEWDPDLDKYSASYHPTKEAAEKAAITESKKAGQTEWILVAEQNSSAINGSTRDAGQAIGMD